MRYPELAAERDAWILAQRPARNQLDPLRPSAFLVEEERSATGGAIRLLAIRCGGRFPRKLNMR
jgi:hypothetical protein